MYDKCLACGRPIFTVRMPGITLQQRWTHGGYGFVDRQHVPIPTRHECWCPLEDSEGHRAPCHADVLLELANQAKGGVVDAQAAVLDGGEYARPNYPRGVTS